MSVQMKLKATKKCHVCGSPMEHDPVQGKETCTNKRCQVYGVVFSMPAAYLVANKRTAATKRSRT